MNLVFLFLMSKENLIGLLFNCEVMSNSFVTPWTIIHQASLNPLQYSCLENPRDRGAWWAAIYDMTEAT